jgi:hypothetical protein
MTERESYIQKCIQEFTKNKSNSDEFLVYPYDSDSKTLIVETSIDGIVPESGYDVIIFIIEDFWRSDQVEKWVKVYNEKFSYYRFFSDLSSRDTFMGGIGVTDVNNRKYNLILCQSKKKLSKIRKKILESENYSYWTEDYLKEIVGED